MPLTGEQHERYARQLMLPEFGLEGQQKLFGAKVLIIGAGGLGTPAALYLAAAGIGAIGIADADTVSLSNLQRQILHTTPDLDQSKVKSAKESLQAINPDIAINTYQLYVTKQNICELIAGYDLILDCTDNFASKFMINDACVKMGKAFVHAGIDSMQGQLMTYVPGKSACFRCVFPDMPLDIPQKPIPVIGAVAGVIGTLQAMEAIKHFTGIGELLTGRILCFDAAAMEFYQVELSQRTGCICAA